MNSALLPLLASVFFGSVFHATGQNLISVTPPDAATEVSTSAHLIFTFDTPMDFETILPGNSEFFIGGLQFSSNVEIFGLELRPSESNTVLTVVNTEGWAADATISWALNAPGVLIPFESLAGQPLQTASGAFSTGSGGGEPCDPDETPEGFGKISLSKIVTHEQVGPGTIASGVDPGPSGSVTVLSPSDNPALSATVTMPGRGTHSLSGFGGFFSLAETFETEAELETAWPAGTYTFDIGRSQSPATELSMTMITNTIPVPELQNYTAAQSIDPSKPFTLRWNGFPGAGTNDFVLLTIEDGSNEIFAAPDPCAGIELPNSATSFTLPADLLLEGESYLGNLTFGSFFHNSTSAPESFVSQGFIGNSTSFMISTSGDDPGGQVLLSIEAAPGSPPTITLDGLEPATTYRVEYSPNLLRGSWTPLDSFTTATPAEPLVTTDPSGTSGLRFYRAVIP